MKKTTKSSPKYKITYSSGEDVDRGTSRVVTGDDETVFVAPSRDRDEGQRLCNKWIEDRKRKR